MTTSVLSWNILSGGFNGYKKVDAKPLRFNDFVKTVKELNTEIVSLVDTYRWSEIFTESYLKKTFGYPYVYSVKLDDPRLIELGHDNGITVFSRIPDTTFETIRIVTRNAIKINAGKFDIFSVYLDDVNEDTRIKQLNAVLEMVKPDTPSLIIGDLNTIDRDDLANSDKEILNLKNKFPGPMKSMENSLNEMKRCEVTQILKNSGFIDFGTGRGNTIPAKLFPLPIDKPVLRFDYAFGSKSVNLEEFRVLTDEKYGNLSDHYPIWLKAS